jgi:hypothetical protein
MYFNIVLRFQRRFLASLDNWTMTAVAKFSSARSAGIARIFLSKFL